MNLSTISCGDEFNYIAMLQCYFLDAIVGIIVTGFAKTVPIGTTIEIQFMAQN